MKHGLQNLKIALFGLLTVTLLLVTVLQVLPKKQGSDLQAKEAFCVSSSLMNVAQKQYSSQLTGVIYNASQNTVKVSFMKIRLSDGASTKDVVLEGFLLPAHGEKNVFYAEEGMQDWKNVENVTVVVNGEEVSVQDATVVPSTSGLFWISVMLLLICAFFLVHSCMVRYYMSQEDEMTRKN